MITERTRVFRFASFEASESAGELRKQGIRIKMHAQPFQILTMLLESAPEIVTRDAMRERLWDKDTFVDFDHALNTAVNKIREALDDSAAHPRYIETVAGKGYRFIAPVEATPSRAPEPAPLAIRAEPNSILTTPSELPSASRTAVKTLLIAAQLMYLVFYLSALDNLSEIHEIFIDAAFPATASMAILITTALVLIPVRLYILTAVALNFKELALKFRRLFPILLVLDLLWALSPFLLVNHVSVGLALGLSAPLIYLPFAQRSLVLMHAR